LANISDEKLVSDQITNEGSEIIEPCFIGKNVKLINAKVGPYVSIGEGSVIENSTVENTIIYSNAYIQNAAMKNSMIGNYVEYDGSAKELSLSDYSTQKD
jgi:glucose-1-phosphate thymidylyltransferase